jgi:UDP-N-acetyl-D-mannosaminuronic acid dehydrogenase
MPGRLVERVRSSDKLVGGLTPLTPTLIERLYRWIVTSGQLHPTNSLTAEIVKTLENAYRDVRIAFAAELARYCDEADIDFFALRERINARLGQEDGASYQPGAIPSGGVLIPTIGVGGHCLPKDGVLLWWRLLESGDPTDKSLILAARAINDTSPAATLRLAERAFGSLAGRRTALLGTAYRPDSEDTRNSPTLSLATTLRRQGSQVILHDPYVSAEDQNLEGSGLMERFTRDLDRAVSDADIVFLCTGHQVYAGTVPHAVATSSRLTGLVVFGTAARRSLGRRYAGIGRGSRPPSAELIDAGVAWFRATERGVANELGTVVDVLNHRYAGTDFERADFEVVRRLAATCVTGCPIVERGPVGGIPILSRFRPTLAALAANGDRS